MLWVEKAQCGGILSFIDWPVERQKAYCKRCPVISQCAEATKDEGPLPEHKAGVRAGVAPEERVPRRFREPLCPRGHLWADTLTKHSGRWVCGTCESERRLARPRAGRGIKAPEPAR